MTGWRARLADWFERQADHELGKAIVHTLAGRPRMAAFRHRQGLAAERIGRALRGQTRLTEERDGERA